MWKIFDQPSNFPEPSFRKFQNAVSLLQSKGYSVFLGGYQIGLFWGTSEIFN